MNKIFIFLIIPIIFFSCKTTSININESTKKIIYKSDASSDQTSDNVYEKIVFSKKNQEEINAELKELQVRQTSKYAMKIGDVYNIFVQADEKFNTSNAIVKSDGFMSIKILGEVDVEGHSLEEVKIILEKRLREYINISPKVSILPVKIKDSQVNILGEVNKPGIYNIEGTTKLLDVICAAGGVSVLQLQNEKIDIADLDSAYIVRNDKLLPVDFNELIIKGNPLHNIIVQDKDYIYIPSLSSKQVFILGEVGSPEQ